MESPKWKLCVQYEFNASNLNVLLICHSLGHDWCSEVSLFSMFSICQSSCLQSVSVGWDGGVYVQTCGHTLHIDCHKSYMESLRVRIAVKSYNLSSHLSCIWNRYRGSPTTVRESICAQWPHSHSPPSIWNDLTQQMVLESFIQLSNIKWLLI